MFDYLPQHPYKSRAHEGDKGQKYICHSVVCAVALLKADVGGIDFGGVVHAEIIPDDQ